MIPAVGMRKDGLGNMNSNLLLWTALVAASGAYCWWGLRRLRDLETAYKAQVAEEQRLRRCAEYRAEQADENARDSAVLASKATTRLKKIEAQFEATALRCYQDGLPAPYVEKLTGVPVLDVGKDPFDKHAYKLDAYKALGLNPDGTLVAPPRFMERSAPEANLQLQLEEARAEINRLLMPAYPGHPNPALDTAQPAKQIAAPGDTQNA